MIIDDKHKEIILDALNDSMEFYVDQKWKLANAGHENTKYQLEQLAKIKAAIKEMCNEEL